MATFFARSVVEPTRAEMEAMVTIPDVAAWAQLDGDSAIGLLDAIGASANSDITVVASIDAVDLNDALNEWRIS